MSQCALVQFSNCHKERLAKNSVNSPKLRIHGRGNTRSHVALVGASTKGFFAYRAKCVYPVSPQEKQGDTAKIALSNLSYEAQFTPKQAATEKLVKRGRGIVVETRNCK